MRTLWVACTKFVIQGSLSACIVRKESLPKAECDSQIDDEKRTTVKRSCAPGRREYQYDDLCQAQIADQTKKVMGGYRAEQRKERQVGERGKEAAIVDGRRRAMNPLGCHTTFKVLL